jgi:hypothetical protein
VKKRKKIFFIILVTIGLLVAANLVFRFYYQVQYDRRVQTLAEQGFPVSLADLEESYVLPEGAANAADVYIEAFSHFQQPNEYEKEYLPITGAYRWPEDVPPFPQEVMAALESFLERNQLTLELLDEAAGLEQCVWPRTLSDFYFSNDHLFEIKKLAQLLCEQNLYLAQTGETDELPASFQSLTALSGSLLKQPVLIDYLVSVAVSGLAAQNLEAVLNEVEFTETELKQLQAQFIKMRNTDDLYDTLFNERCAMIVAYDLPLKKRVHYLMGRSGVAVGLYFLSGINQQDKGLSLDFHDRFLEVSQLPSHQRQSALAQIRQEIDAYSGFHFHVMDLLVLDKVFKIGHRVMGGLYCAETALAVERYRLARGELPGSLEDLVSAFLEVVPLEPFDGEPLRYIRHADGGYTVYCIGDDWVDNGGLSKEQMAEQTGEENPEEYDWPFTVRR